MYMGKEFGPQIESRIESPETSLSFEAATRASIKHPERNEDAYFYNPKSGVFGVFDGVGGHERGEIASHVAAMLFEAEMKLLPANASKKEITATMKKIFERINSIIAMIGIQKKYKNISRELTQSTDIKLLTALVEKTKKVIEKSTYSPHSRSGGIGSTATVIKILPGDASTNKQMVIANLGDSRTYILHSNGRLEQITLDDSSFDGPEKEARELQQRLSEIKEQGDLKNEREREYFYSRNIISRSLGLGESATPTIYTPWLFQGDVVLATTDGVHDNLTDKEITEILLANKEAERARVLVEQAYMRSLDRQNLRAKKDDITAVLYTF